MSQVRRFRIVLAVIVVAMLVGGFFIDAGRAEYTYVRYIGVVLMLMLGAATYASEFLRRQVGWVALACACIALYVFADYMMRAQLDTMSCVSMLGLLFAGSLMMQSRLVLLIWCFVAVAATGIAALSVSQPGLYPDVFMMCVVTVLIATSILVVLQHESAEQRDRIAELAETVISQSPNGIVYGYVSTGEIVQASARILDMFETRDKGVLRDCLQASLIDALGDRASPSGLLDLVGDAYSSEMEFTCASGRKFWGKLNMVPLAGVHDMLLATVADLSEQKSREQKLDKALHAAQVAVKARTKFLANMSHEIRTPMNGVIGMTSLLQNSGLNKEQSSYLDVIRSSGESLLEIINEILDFAKIEAGEVELEERPFELERCVAEALDVVATLAAQKGLELSFDILPEDLGWITGDGSRLRQVLVNLLSNAIKFTPRGEVILRVRVDKPGVENSLAGAPASIRFSVIDTGIGIQPEVIQHLFEPFSQADSTTTREFGGTGLGLSISAHLVERMGGTIAVNSKPGEGSEFSFDMPAPWRPVAAWRERGDLSGKMVFAVDDNASNRAVLEGFLKWAGLQYRVFATPFELLEAYQPGGCDLIVTDMSMPKMDGLGMLHALKAKHSAVVPVVLLASLDRGNVDWSQFDQVLRKPVRPTELISGILSALESESERNDLASNNGGLREFESERVLLAEDNVVNQTVARKILGRLGLQVDVAEDGQQALDMLKETPYGLVFMDMQMPNVDGVEAAHRIRGGEVGSQPYIIALTANVMAEDRERCIEAGMNDFVGKPVKLGDLRAALSRAAVYERFMARSTG